MKACVNMLITMVTLNMCEIESVESNEVAFDEWDHCLKVVLVGDIKVGKSSILSRSTKNEFTTKYTATKGVDFKLKCYKIDGKYVKAQIWDLSGDQWECHCSKFVSDGFYRWADGAILVYDVTDSKSFENLTKRDVIPWVDKIKKYGIKQTVLVGNKCDLEEKRQVTTEQGKQLADEYGLEFIETSALTGSNVEEISTRLVKSIYKQGEMRSGKNREIPRAEPNNNSRLGRMFRDCWANCSRIRVLCCWCREQNDDEKSGIL